MEIYNQFVKLENVSLALGFFDGVHLGHQAVISSAVEHAGNDKSAVITFKHSPCETFGIACKYISSIEERRELIEKLGVDYLFEIDFTKEMSQMSGEEYLKTLVEYFTPKSITTGFNHTFGKNKSGNPELLEELQNKYSYKYYKIPVQKSDNVVISSTQIKDYLVKGEIEKANKMLGYEFSIGGTVIHGNHLGNKIGFPTANITYPDYKVQIPYGVYATDIDKYNAMTNFGIKPTVSSENIPVVESHILNFDKNIYNTHIEVKFKKQIREEKKFESLEQLIEQINKDKLECSK